MKNSDFCKENEEYINKLYECLDSFGRDTIKLITENNPNFKEKEKISDAAEAEYNKVLDTLDEEKREKIKDYIEKELTMYTEYSSLTYCAGVCDAIRVMRLLNLLRL